MESIRTAKNVIQPGDWMAKLDLKDAYLSVPIHRDSRKFLRFRWQGKTWQFKVLPFGLSSAPYMFTKLTKPVASLLRTLGMRIVLYLDDMLLVAESTELVRRMLATALELLVCLGFVINLEKSVLIPSQKLEFLGFVLDTRGMSISLPESKLRSLHELARQMAQQGKATLRELARLLGTMVAAHPAILPAPLYYRSQVSGSEEWPAIRGGSPSESRDGERSVIVDIRGGQEQWQNTASASMGPHYRVRCLHDGLGSQLRSDFHRRPMDTGGEISQHKLPGAVGSLPGPQIICINLQVAEHSPENRQCNCDNLSQQDGRVPLPSVVGPGTDSMEVVPGKGHYYSC